MAGKVPCAILLLVALLFQVTVGAKFPKVACPKIFRYVRINSKYMGELQVFKKNHPTTLTLEINMTVQAQVKSNKNIKIVVLSNQEEIVESNKLKYGIRFPIQKPLPKLTSARFNKRTICKSRPDPLRPGKPQTAMWARTTIKLKKKPIASGGSSSSHDSGSGEGKNSGSGHPSSEDGSQSGSGSSEEDDDDNNKKRRKLRQQLQENLPAPP